GRYEDLPAGNARHQLRGPGAGRDAEQPAQQAQRHRLHEELQQDAAARRAERHADADLARPLRDADEHNVHDPDAADDQAHARDAREQHREGLLGFLLRFEEVAPVYDREVVAVARTQPVLLAQHALDVHHRALERDAVHHPHADVVDFLAPEHALLGGLERDECARVRTAVAEAASAALARENADHLERLSVEGDRLAEQLLRIDLELLRDLCAEHDDPTLRDVLVRAKESAVLDLVVEDFGETVARADRPAVRVAVEILQLPAALHLRDDRVEVTGLPLERLGVVHRQRLLVSRHTLRQESRRVDGQDVRAEGGDLLVDALLGAGAGREHSDPRADADDAAEHRQHGAEKVRVYRLERDADNLAEEHQ